jgi:hypothetical protein
MYRFSVTAVGNVCLMILEEANKCAIPESKTHETYLRLSSSYRGFQDSIDRRMKSENSPVAMAAEKRRDDALLGARSIVGGLMCSPDATVRAKALRVFSKLDKFGAGVERLKNEDENTKLLSIISGLDEPEMKVLVGELAITSYVEELRAANTEYLKSWGVREDDVEAFRNSTSATSQMNDIQEAVDGYYDYVVSMSKYGTKKEEWAKLVSGIQSRFVTLKQNQQHGKITKKDVKPTDSK